MAWHGMGWDGDGDGDGDGRGMRWAAGIGGEERLGGVLQRTGLYLEGCWTVAVWLGWFGRGEVVGVVAWDGK
jgi:hypothetical protein